MAYSAAFKAKVVQKLLLPNGPTQGAVSRETGVPQTTLSRWVQRARTIAPMSSKSTSKRRKWTADEKLRVVLEASRLPDEELGAFLRREARVMDYSQHGWRTPSPAVKPACVR